MKLKTAIITGGSKGIGLRIAKSLAKNKYNIVICSRHLPALKKAKKEIESFGVKCIAVKADVSNYTDCKKVVQTALKKLSGIDLLVNNAGYQGPVGKSWKNNTSNWKKTIDINLLGTFYMSHEVLPHMLKKNSGIILNLSGGGGAYARPLFSAYGCSKTAVLRLTETLGEELKGKNISVIAIAPGATWTEMTETVLRKNKKSLDKKTLNELIELEKYGGTSSNKLEEFILYLITSKSNKFSGKLVHVNELTKIKQIKSKIGPESGVLRRVNY